MKCGRICSTRWQWLFWCALFSLMLTTFSAAASAVITNVLQFDRLVTQSQQTNRPVKLEGDVCWADVEKGMVVFQDSSGTSLIEAGSSIPTILPGAHITLEGVASEGHCGASLKIAGLELKNGRHYGLQDQFGSIMLKAGKYPISAGWYGGNNSYGFNVYYEGPNLARQTIADSALCHPVVSASGQTNWAAGLICKTYKGQWSTASDFEKLEPSSNGEAANFNVELSSDEENAGVVFNGYLKIDRDGIYGFSLEVEGRRKLFVENPVLTIVGQAGAPTPLHVMPGQILPRAEESLWGETEGTVTFVGKKSHGLRLELKSENGSMSVEIADATRAAPLLLMGSRIQVTGVCKGSYGPNGQTMLGTMWLPTFEGIKILEVAPEVWASHPVSTIRELVAGNPAPGTIVQIKGLINSVRGNSPTLVQDRTGIVRSEMVHAGSFSVGDSVAVVGGWKMIGTNCFLENGFCRKIEPENEATNPLPVLTTAEAVKRLQREEALRGYPVKIQGVVTWSGGSGFVIQDSTMGIFSETVNPETSGVEHEGTYIEIEGVTTAQFSPMILAQRINHLGLGTFPEPIRPTWDQLMNGTLDTQFVEVQGIVTAVEGTRITLLTHEGKLRVDLPEKQFGELKRYADALIRIRGCLWATKDEETHKLLPGEIQIHNGSVSVDEAAPDDLLDAPQKRVSELLLFDAKASALQRVKVVGQVIHQRDDEYFLMDGANGMRFVSRSPVSLGIGDQVEVVGFPLLGGPSPVLREAMAKQIGSNPLPEPKLLTDSNLLNPDSDSMLVKIDAQLMNISQDQKDRIFELQTGQHMFIACLARKRGPLVSVPIGSRVEVTGVYSVQSQDKAQGRNIDSFELLLNSFEDVRVLARPSWWTIRRMLGVVGVLVGVLTAALVWIGLLHRQVEQRTGQLKEEILVRQRAEQLRAVEEERSRIARDLHDDLGSSLTEISMLADAGAGTPPVLEKAERRFQTIGEKARTIVNALDVIVWLVNPRKDLLPFSVSYLGSYAEEYLSAARIACRLKVPSKFPPMRLAADLRHNIFLAVKETLHNIVRHSKATEVNMEIALTGGELQIIIADNGIGLSSVDSVNGNGLVNLKDRLAQIGGSFQISSQPNIETRVSLIIPLPQN